MIRAAFLLALAALAMPIEANAKSRKIVEPLAEGLAGNNHVVAVEVVISETASEAMVKFEQKAAETRADRNLAPVDPATPPSGRSDPDNYSSLPFAVMFPLVMEDVTREWGLTGGRPIKLKVTVDTLKTANAAMAWLGGSSDQLAGLVELSDPSTQEALGSFYIDVINGHSGLMGMAMRGSGIREKLSEEFALESSRILTGSKKKGKKASPEAS